MRRILLFALFVVCLGQSAVAAGSNKAVKHSLPPTEVQMPFLIAPVEKDGEFLGYMYIASKLTTTSAQASQKVKEKLAFIQDALVRDVNLTVVATEPDAQKLDKPALAARVVAIVGRFVGKENVVKLEFIDVKFAPLHPLPGGIMFAPDSSAPPPQAPPPATTEPKKDGSH